MWEEKLLLKLARKGNRNLDNMGRHIIDETIKTTTTTGKYGNKNPIIWEDM